MNEVDCTAPPARVLAAHGRWRRTFRLRSPWRLEPLSIHHADELAVQYRNTETAALTGLPPINESFDVAQWIAARNEESEATYALMHDRFGLVGYGDLYLSRDEGYMCLWIGEDFRGRGWSKVLIAHLCALAQRAGLSVIWSSAYSSNHASLRAMASVGFRTLELRALAPDDARIFVCMPFAYRTPADVHKGMVDFCQRTGTGVRFAGYPSSHELATQGPS